MPDKVVAVTVSVPGLLMPPPVELFPFSMVSPEILALVTPEPTVKSPTEPPPLTARALAPGPAMAMLVVMETGAVRTMV